MSYHVPRRFLATIVPRAWTTHGQIVIFDPWGEEARTWDYDPACAFRGTLTTCAGYSKQHHYNRNPLIGRPIEFVITGAGRSLRDLPHIAHAPLCEFGVFNRRANVADSLTAAGPEIRGAVIKALVGGVPGNDGEVRAKIGASEIVVNPTTGAWSITHADGHRRAGRNLRRFVLALGAVPDGVAAVRLLETIFKWKIPPDAALKIADAIDECAPIPKEVRP
ncbi:hypothetical protein EYW49_09065 [Siculibacillus lacustris]|uniref:Uncharacterized protein n=1 Tax=Siculibacillus lacustris TaxID=1549641 RepID=A0A4Q9VR96_9HYPH|nr:hypothetical protein [Siculibacillus lacustris]TBW38411.1 hypothetical protein EYW49_09065 [Siculibacillus lacustris]